MYIDVCANLIKGRIPGFTFHDVRYNPILFTHPHILGVKFQVFLFLYRNMRSLPISPLFPHK